MNSFPDVPEEPTTLIDLIADDDMFPVYERIQCPNCENDAFQYHGQNPSEIVCRNCRIGKRLLKKKVNYGSAWNQVRKWVLERDNHTCQNCGQNGGELHVHHIDNVVWFKTTDNAHRPENLSTLCSDCHEFGP